jgi:hypothetical protein
VTAVRVGGDRRHLVSTRSGGDGGVLSGVPHEHLWGYVVEVKEERIVYFRAYYEPEEALEAVGVSD